MASTPRIPRRGLPRTPGGEPWPPAASSEPGDADPGTAGGSSQNDADLAGSASQGASFVTDSEESKPGVAAGAAAAGDSGAAVAVGHPGAAGESSQNDADLAGSASQGASFVTDSEESARSAVGGAEAVTEVSLRRGLPREPGGEPWPPASAVPPSAAPPATAPESENRAEIGAAGVSRPISVDGSDLGALPASPQSAPDRESGSGADAESRASASGSGGEARQVDAPGPESDASTSAGGAPADVRRGLPRELGGEPWPPASAVPPSAAPPATAPESENRAEIGDIEPARPIPVTASDFEADAGTPVTAAVGGSGLGADAETAARSGGTARAAASTETLHAAASPGTLPASASTASAGAADTNPAPAADARPAAAPPRPPLTVPRTVWPGAAARNRATTPARAQKRPTAPPRAGAQTRLADFSPVQLLGSTAVLGVFALALVGIAVLVARLVLAIGPGREFLAAFPGEYHLPESAPVGLPAWVNWSHFLNSFFLLLIIRTGWQVRREKRPAAFWSPRTNKRRRISLALWFHQVLDILWIANGVIFVVLLFVTGQWMRIVPTSWEVFPNALSAALQYASLDWPTENGWVNYNSLQQLSYFAITFIAAPLAIVSGVRLSGVWPKNAEKLNKLYPVEWARKVHFPTMLFFVAFIIVHVALVLATGALRNLNHMYAARGSEDPAAYTSDPTGLLIFAASLVVMAAAWVAARPAVLVPIARLFGEVKQR